MTRPLALALACLASAAGAQSAPACFPRATIEAAAAKLGQTPHVVMLNRVGQMVEMWVRPDDGTWTATATSPSGVTCVLTSGTDWHVVAPPPGDPA